MRSLLRLGVPMVASVLSLVAVHAVADGRLTLDGKTVMYGPSARGDQFVDFEVTVDTHDYGNVYVLDCENKRFLWTKNFLRSTGEDTGNSAGAEWKPMNPGSTITNAVYQEICPGMLAERVAQAAPENLSHRATNTIVQEQKASRGVLSSAWYGSWESLDGNETLIIAQNRMDVSKLREEPRSDGRRVKWSRRWRDAEEANVSHPYTFGYTQSWFSKEALKRRFEEALHRQDEIFSVHAPEHIAGALDGLSTGEKETLWAYDEGDFDTKYVMDGNNLLEIQDTMYAFSVRPFHRVAAGSKESRNSEESAGANAAPETGNMTEEGVDDKVDQDPDAHFAHSSTITREVVWDADSTNIHERCDFGDNECVLTVMREAGAKEEALRFYRGQGGWVYDFQDAGDFAVVSWTQAFAANTIQGQYIVNASPQFIDISSFHLDDTALANPKWRKVLARLPEGFLDNSRYVRHEDHDDGWRFVVRSDYVECRACRDRALAAVDVGYDLDGQGRFLGARLLRVELNETLFPDDDATKQGRTTLSVKDGSVLAGTIAGGTLRFKSSFGTIRVSADEVVSFADGKLQLKDGTVLYGAFGGGEIEVETSVGKLEVDGKEIAGIEQGAAVGGAFTSGSKQAVPDATSRELEGSSAPDELSSPGKLTGSEADNTITRRTISTQAGSAEARVSKANITPSTVDGTRDRGESPSPVVSRTHAAEESHRSSTTVPKFNNFNLDNRDESRPPVTEAAKGSLLADASFSVGACQPRWLTLWSGADKDLSACLGQRYYVVAWVPPELTFDKHSDIQEVMRKAYSYADRECANKRERAQVYVIHEREDVNWKRSLSRDDLEDNSIAWGCVDRAGAVQVYFNAQAEHFAEETVRHNQRARLLGFLRETGAEAVPSLDAFTANPYPYEGNVVLLESIFSQMLSRSEAMFGESVIFGVLKDPFLVSSVPVTRFSAQTEVLLAARVVGTKVWTTPAGADAQLAHVQYIDAFEGVYSPEDLRWALQNKDGPAELAEQEPLPDLPSTLRCSARPNRGNPCQFGQSQ